MEDNLMSSKTTDPPEIRVGVYVCHCGMNIAGAVDCQAVAEDAVEIAQVAVAKDYSYLCSEPGQQLMREEIERFLG